MEYRSISFGGGEEGDYKTWYTSMTDFGDEQNIRSRCVSFRTLVAEGHEVVVFFLGVARKIERCLKKKVGRKGRHQQIDLALCCSLSWASQHACGHGISVKRFLETRGTRS
jgi:hypothetical protein